MLDGSFFLRSGCVHGLRIHQFEACGSPILVVMGKVSLVKYKGV